MAERVRSTDRVRDAAEAAGLAIEIREMPQSTRTAAEAAAACGTSVAQIVKSLIFRKAESGEPVLILVSGQNRVDEKAMKAIVGEALKRIDADQVRALTGFAIGGVAPLGSLAPLQPSWTPTFWPSKRYGRRPGRRTPSSRSIRRRLPRRPAQRSSASRSVPLSARS